MAEVQIQDLNNPVASWVDHICHNCQHKNVCKYEKDFLINYTTFFMYNSMGLYIIYY